MLLSIIGLVSIAISVSASSAKQAFNWNSTKEFIAFGDSYTYVQGVFGRQNYSFIGDNFNIPFTPEELLSNLIVQNQTSTAEGGPNWVEFLTGCGLKEGLTDPRSCGVHLWDFAFAGADISEVLTPLHHNYTVSLEKQVQQFVDYGNPALTPFVNKHHTLVAFWIGINDINDLAKPAGNATFATLYDQLQTQHFELVERAYELGYRQFLFLNLPPLDRGPPTPSVNATTVSLFNNVLTAHATNYSAARPDAEVLLFDVNSVLNRVLDNYESFGFTNITNYCPGYNQPDIETDPGKYGCDSLDKYFWYNSGHLTSRTHEVFTKELRKFLVDKSG
ncbi:carbohydrate esterase family 16 protein [Lophiostoma macrostomum CBS 122681]|uniref:Carbohydrate esterase family 16 protein n=1 Tax=Lophiostoma macrostomum CBS 122681 TaxID=1314788 RepID=A0A6A6SMB5_9PLEO|nr:carbohydrate esterase family 16 protein [Lophiostoma macrostomum CBS 122681]